MFSMQLCRVGLWTCDISDFVFHLYWTIFITFQKLDLSKEVWRMDGSVLFFLKGRELLSFFSLFRYARLRSSLQVVSSPRLPTLLSQDCISVRMEPSARYRRSPRRGKRTWFLHYDSGCGENYIFCNQLVVVVDLNLNLKHCIIRLVLGSPDPYWTTSQLVL